MILFVGKEIVKHGMLIEFGELLARARRGRKGKSLYKSRG
jgi:hypothetical protein